MEQDKIWDYFQNEGVNSFEGSYGRLNFLIKQCGVNMKILNIGVGNGIFEKIALSNNIDIYTLDPSEKAIFNIQKKLGMQKAKVGYSQNIPFEDDFFDMVIMSEVLEHLDDSILIATISEVNRVLKQDGKFIGTVPYNENLSEQLVVCPKCGEQFHRWGHIQSFGEENLAVLLKKNFSNISLKPKMFINWNTLNIKGKMMAFINYLVYMINVKKSGLNLFFEARK